VSIATTPFSRFRHGNRSIQVSVLVSFLKPKTAFYKRDKISFLVFEARKGRALFSRKLSVRKNILERKLQMAGDAHGHSAPWVRQDERALLSAWQKQGRDWLVLRGKVDLAL
jgi:hypothetical protein